MARLIVNHRVENFAKWKRLFDSSEIIRKIYGEESFQIFRSTDDPNDVSIIFDWKSTEKVLKYAQSNELQNAMKLAGVLDEPKIYILDGVLEQ